VDADRFETSGQQKVVARELPSIANGKIAIYPYTKECRMKRLGMN